MLIRVVFKIESYTFAKEIIASTLCHYFDTVSVIDDFPAIVIGLSIRASGRSLQTEFISLKQCCPAVTIADGKL